MNRQTKLILTVLGLCAVIIPVVLLWVFTAKTPPVAQVPAGKRDINETNIKETVKKIAPDLVSEPNEPISTGSAIFGSSSPLPTPKPSASPST